MKKLPHLTRIKTGLILGLLTIGSIFFLSNNVFAILCAILVSCALWEWFDLVQICSFVYKALCFVGFWVLVELLSRDLNAVLIAAFIWWVLATLLIFVPIPQLQVLRNRFLQFLIATLVLGSLWISIVALHRLSPTVLFYLIMLVCFADTAAYFVGSRYGKHKLLPSVSPKKSIEGLVGGLVVGSIAGLSVVLFMPDLTTIKFAGWFILGIFLIIVSVIGDLFESLMKRLFEAKDSGSLLPGHGGVLDRLDSLAATFPIYLLILLQLHIV